MPNHKNMIQDTDELSYLVVHYYTQHLNTVKVEHFPFIIKVEEHEQWTKTQRYQMCWLATVIVTVLSFVWVESTPLTYIRANKIGLISGPHV